MTTRALGQGLPNELQDIIFKNTKASDISSFMIKTVPLDGSWRKPEIFEKKTFFFEKVHTFSMSSGVTGMPGKELIWKR